MKKLLISLCLIILMGCQSTAEVMKTWLGHTTTELFQSWGAPDNKIEHGVGGNVYTYHFFVYDSMTNTRVKSAVRSFTVDSDGIITHVMWRN